MKTIMRCIAASAVVHALFFAKLSCGGGGGSGDKEGGEGSGTIKITVVDKSEKKADSGHEQCPSAFAGVGISYDLFEGGRVTEVHTGYPAARAGILVGDRIIGDPAAIRGEPGTPVSVRVERDGKELLFDMTRERICTVSSK